MRSKTRKWIIRYRWVAPDGQKGRWLETLGGAERSAVNTRFSNPAGGVTVSLCRRSAYAMWPSVEADGWSIETERTEK